jgi:branched-subunit amino acid ABC-type transport system permease component
MNPATWKMLLALACGSGIGVGLRRGLMSLFGHSGSAVSVSTVTVSSILGGFCGVAMGWLKSSAFSKEQQMLAEFALFSLMATIAADATAAQAEISPEDLVRMRRRALAHVVIGISAALIGIALGSLFAQYMSS